MDIRSQGKRRAIVVTTAVGLAGLATTVVGSALLWNDSATGSTQSVVSGTAPSPDSTGSADDGWGSSESDMPSTPVPTQQPLVAPSQGGAVQGRSSGS
jgi:hypothetical protein